MNQKCFYQNNREAAINQPIPDKKQCSFGHSCGTAPPSKIQQACSLDNKGRKRKKKEAEITCNNSKMIEKRARKFKNCSASSEGKLNGFWVKHLTHLYPFIDKQFNKVMQ